MFSSEQAMNDYCVKTKCGMLLPIITNMPHLLLKSGASLLFVWPHQGEIHQYIFVVVPVCTQPLLLMFNLYRMALRR